MQRIDVEGELKHNAVCIANFSEADNLLVGIATCCLLLDPQ